MFENQDIRTCVPNFDGGHFDLQLFVKVFPNKIVHIENFCYHILFTCMGECIFQSLACQTFCIPHAFVKIFIPPKFCAKQYILCNQ